MATEDQIDKFYSCADKHHMVIQRVGAKSASIGGTRFFRICKFCGLLETKLVTMAKDRQGNIYPKVEMFVSIAGRNISMPIKTYRLVREVPQDQPPGEQPL